MQYSKRFNFLTEEIKNQVLAEVQRVIDGELVEVEMDMFDASIITNYITEKYNLYIHNVENNGWEGDSWYQYIIDGKNFTVFCSAYSGRVRFSMNEDDLPEDIEFDDEDDAYENEIECVSDEMEFEEDEE